MLKGRAVVSYRHRCHFCTGNDAKAKVATATAWHRPSAFIFLGLLYFQEWRRAKGREGNALLAITKYKDLYYISLVGSSALLLASWHQQHVMCSHSSSSCTFFLSFWMVGLEGKLSQAPGLGLKFHGTGGIFEK